MMDCRALLEVLHRTQNHANPALKQILIAASRVDEKIWALNAPFDRKELLKGRGYRWFGEEPKAWWIALPRSEAFEERKWLLNNVYPGSTAKVRIDVMDAYSRYSERLTDSKVRQISLTDSDQMSLEL
jgi:DNA polymerase-3 subunit epsilon